MPWKAQVCPFCEKKYANKTGLRKHLIRYTGEWRIPADGIHDVLKIQKIIDPELRRECQYRCPTCSTIIKSRERFIDHVYYRRHYGHYDPECRPDTKKQRRKGVTWPLPFEEEEVKVWQRKGAFQFLHLPFELRRMIYKFVLFFGNITFRQGIRAEVAETHRQGIWLQHNPHKNPLALLAVNRQIYDEGRQIFYGLNSFTFRSRDSVPIFLIGIGRENAELLRSVQWEDEQRRCENRIDLIRSCLMRMEGADTPAVNRLDIWNDGELYRNLLRKLGAIPPNPLWLSGRRLLRLDANSTSADDIRSRYHLDVILGKEDAGSLTKVDHKGTVWFELYVQRDEKMRWTPPLKYRC